MPSIEFVLPEKLLFIFSNISVISFCFFISFLFAKLFRSFLMFFLLSISIASIFYGDIFLKYGIRTYHILFNMDSKILIKNEILAGTHIGSEIGYMSDKFCDWFDYNIDEIIEEVRIYKLVMGGH